MRRRRRRAATNERKIGRVAVVGVGRRGRAQVELLPDVGEGVAVGVGRRRGQGERRAARDGEVGAGVDRGRRVAGGRRDRRRRPAVRVGDVRDDLVEAPGVEDVVAVAAEGPRRRRCPRRP